MSPTVSLKLIGGELPRREGDGREGVNDATAVVGVNDIMSCVSVQRAESENCKR